jgi:phage terminase large subunit-like protein
MKNVRPSPPSPVAALPIKRVRELWCIIGRRGGKSRMAAALACYFALFVKHKLAGGERGMVLVLAATTEQARVVFDYTRAFLNSSPVLQKEICQHDAKRNTPAQWHRHCHPRQQFPRDSRAYALRLRF